MGLLRPYKQLVTHFTYNAESTQKDACMQIIIAEKASFQSAIDKVLHAIFLTPPHLYALPSK